MLGRLVGSLMGTRIAPPLAVPDEVVIRTGRWIPTIGGWLSGHAGPAAAVALGRTIVVHPGVVLTQRLLRHELAHVRQWQERPLTFPLRYTWQHMRHGYRANPYEVEAREAESRES
jgi:hypothetical protein